MEQNTTISTFRSKTTQKEQVLNYLKDFGSITDTEARNMLCISRLSGRICELRKEGHDITDEWIVGTNMFGIKYRCKRYILKEGE